MGPLLLASLLAIGSLQCDRAEPAGETSSEPSAPSAPSRDTAVSDRADSDTAATEESDDSPYVSRIDLATLESSGTLDEVDPLEVTVERDPAYKETKTFRGWPLQAVMAHLPEVLGDEQTYVVQFIAVDGYRASVPLDELPVDAGVVAFADTDAPEGQSWSSFDHGDERTTPAPYYLVWPEGDHATDQLPWSYKLAAIGIAPARELWGAAYPSHDPEARPGFDLFRQKCIKCHAVNRAGGSVGPELNVPMSVTEYFQPEHLRRFIRDAPSYRAGITMPPFEGLSDAELDRIVGYLDAMAEAKVCTTASACAATPK
jgi:mono/diheme cytochrome c family protein